MGNSRRIAETVGELRTKVKIMNKLSKRLGKLENTMNPKPKRIVRVIQEIGETQEQALEREGIKDLETTLLIVRKIIEHKPLMEN